MKSRSTVLQSMFHSRAFQLLYPMAAVLLFGIYPVVYFYRKNVALVLLSSLGRVLLVYLVVIVIVYAVCLLLTRFKALKAAIAASVFMLFFNTYGIVYNFILNKDLVLARHYTLLPLYLLVAVYLAWLVTRLKKKYTRGVWSAIAILFLLLNLVSLISSIPAEISKARFARANKGNAPVALVENSGEKQPDIYSPVFDDFTGFKPMREYWHTPEVDPFKQWLLDKGFFVAEDVHSSGTSTLHQMSIRLNYVDYPDIPDQEEKYYNLIANNQAMAFVKARGYTTVAFDEVSWLYQAMPKINADVVYNIDPDEISDFGMIFDDFGVLITNNTMVYAFSNLYQLEDFGYRPHRNFIFSTVDHLGNMEDIPQPRFIYSHLMIPHRPYMYDRTGALLDAEFYRDWDYYEGYWAYSLGIIQQMVDNILADADPENPPVIILQSDHGARLRVGEYNYPKEYLTSLLFAMYLPGVDTSTIPQDINPVNTFPLVFNNYLDAQIPIQ